MTPTHTSIDSISHHRNGVSGKGFHVVLFRHKQQRFVGIVFPTPGHVAILERDLLAQDEIRFGENSWRGDEFEEELREAIGQFEEYQATERHSIGCICADCSNAELDAEDD